MTRLDPLTIHIDWACPNCNFHHFQPIAELVVRPCEGFDHDWQERFVKCQQCSVTFEIQVPGLPVDKKRIPGLDDDWAYNWRKRK